MEKTTNEVLQQLLSLKKTIHSTNVEKGFWEDAEARNKGEMVMLIITELSEAVEAHRKNHFTDKSSPTIAFLEGKALNDGYDYIETWEKAFITGVKDTLEDEIADTVIRLLDYCEGFNFPLLERDFRKSTTGNFSHDILRICNYLIKAYDNHICNGIAPYPGKDFGYALAAIIALCEWNNIDLVQHVQWKLKYNQSRPYKHGKKY